MDITQIILLIITALGLTLTGILLPFIKARVSSEELSNIYALVKIAVYAAEQIFGSKKGAEKKEYVISYLAAKGIYFDTEMIENELNAMIESAVYELSQGVVPGGKEE